MFRKLTTWRMLLTLVWTLGPAWAGPIHELVLRGEGVWSGPAINWTGSEGYIVRLQEYGVLTDFFTFDLTGYADTATSGLLRLTQHWSGGPAPFSYTLMDTNAALWGVGDKYGGITVDGRSAPGEVFEIALNAEALADINASRGVFFSLAGRLEAAPAHAPEPSTWLLLGGGLLAVLLVYSRRSLRHATSCAVAGSYPGVCECAEGCAGRQKRFCHDE